MAWKFNFFREEEFDHPEKMSLPLIAMLDEARAQCSFPWTITSDYREAEPGDRPSAHHYGLAVDIRAPSGAWRLQIVQAALAVGFNRIGVYDKHVHLDIATEFTHENFKPAMWPGKSR